MLEARVKSLFEKICTSEREKQRFLRWGSDHGYFSDMNQLNGILSLGFERIKDLIFSYFSAYSIRKSYTKKMKRAILAIFVGSVLSTASLLADNHEAKKFLRIFGLPLAAAGILTAPFYYRKYKQYYG